MALLVIVLCALSTGCAKRVLDKEQVSPEQKLVIKFSHVVAENTPKGLAAQRFARLVQERTKGRVEVQVFPNSTLYSDGEEMQALKDGSVQIIAPATSKLGALFPSWQLMDLPYAFDDMSFVHQALEGPIGEKLTKSLEEQGFLALAFWDNGFKQLTNNIRPVRKPADLQGLKFRVMMNSSVLEEQFKLLGALPVPLPFNDVYLALENNEIHGQENTISNIYSKKFYQVQKYMTITNHGYLGYVVLTNKEYWEGLPEEIRSILEETMAEVTVWERTAAAEMNELNLKDLQNNGKIENITLSSQEREEWEKALQPVYSYFMKEISAELASELIAEKAALDKYPAGGER